MHVYLSKKIAIPHNIPLKSISWSKSKGWVACGGENGLLKVLKLEVLKGGDPKLRGLAAPSNLTMNQGLEAHESTVNVVKWNEIHQKLTSSDESGLIVVWMLYKGQWCEEMVNNRNHSVVRDMAWNKDGQKICIVYDDGALIVGSVDGNRLWAKDLKGMHLTFVQWSPNSKRLLFGNSRGEVMIYDNLGNFIANLVISCLLEVSGSAHLASLEWYNGINGYFEVDCPSLLVCYSNGRAQIMRNEMDPDPVKLDTGISVNCASWNENGSLFAIGGAQVSEEKEFNIVQFYNTYGEHLHSLRVPGKELTSLSWESKSLRMALAVDSFIYFANLRHELKWGYLSNTVVYSFKKFDRSEKYLMFWNVKSNEKKLKAINSLLSVSCCSDLCLLTVESEDNENEYALLLCNSLGTPVEAKYIPFAPKFIALSYNFVVAASETLIYVWHYRTVSRLEKAEFLHTLGRKGREGKDWTLHVDEVPTGIGEIVWSEQKAQQMTDDAVCAVGVSDKCLVVSRTSGTVQQYTLPRMALENKFAVGCRPQKLYLNCASNLLAVLDINGIFNIFSTNASSGHSEGEVAGLERKDVWDVKWAEDDPSLYAIMEKTRMYVIRGNEPEEPLQSSCHLCEFKDLKVKAVVLDEILNDPESPSQSDVIDFEIKCLRDTEKLLEKVPLEEVFQYVDKSPHPRLWTLLAENALSHLNFEVAEKAFVKLQDYSGLQFVKRVKKLDSEVKQRAEVAAYFKHFEDAERIYLDMDRRNLAVDLRMKLGDWFRVVQLLKTGGGAGDDTLLCGAWNSIGDYYYDRQKFHNAITYYNQGQNFERLLECYFITEDFNGLKKMAEVLTENDPLLQRLGEMFASYGMCSEASAAFQKCSNVKEAIQTCITFSQWDEAIEMAGHSGIPGVLKLLEEQCRHFEAKNEPFKSVELYLKGRQYLKAAKLILKVGKQIKQEVVSPKVMKKLHVLAAFLIESHVASLQMSKQTGLKESGVPTAVQGLMLSDGLTSSDALLVDRAWRGAEAFHFYMLAQNQLYQGQAEAALNTALLLKEYEDFIPPAAVSSLIALVSAVCGAFNVCSKAFISLESTSDISSEEVHKYENLAMDIFIKHPPKDSATIFVQCPSCEETMNGWESMCERCETRFPICIVTGKPLLDYEVWLCSGCKHRAHERHIATFTNCPLCHTPIYTM